MRVLAARLFFVALAALPSMASGCTKTPGSGSNTKSGQRPGKGKPEAGKSGSTAPTAVFAGGEHSCVLRDNGSVACWGANKDGQLGDGGVDDQSRPVVVQGLGDAVDLALGTRHSCARRKGGAVVCWGANNKGQLGTGLDAASRRPVAVRGLGDATILASGGEHACALRASGAVVCWGANADGQLGNHTRQVWNEPAQIRGLNDARALAAGARHSCALRDNGGVICWGANDKGQLGDGGTKGHERPSAVAGLPAVIGLAAAGSRTCAFTEQAMFCWGDDGRGKARVRPVKIAEAGSDSFASVDLGPQHACLRHRSGVARCWGKNDDGRVGDGSTSWRSQPVQVAKLGATRDLATGAHHSCALGREGVLSCWGDDAGGALGQGDAGASGGGSEAAVTRVRRVSGALDLAAGDGFSCVVDKRGEVLCWGRNNLGQLGDASTEPARPAAAPVFGIDDAVAVTAGSSQACAVRRTGAVVCWGENDGRLGRPKSAPLRRPVPVPRIHDAVAVSLGDAHGCALDRSGSVTCWGSDADGQLGDGAGKRGGKVVGLADVVAIDAGRAHTCALRRSGAVSCWGSNLTGQIGNGVGAAELKTPVVQPAQVSKLSDAVEIAVGPHHSCARKRDGKAACWGGNDDGQLGSGTASNVWTTRVPVRDLAGLQAFDVGPAHACGASNRAVACWGDNRAGQGQFAGDSAPTPRVGLSNLEVVQLALGRDHSCARLRDGDVVCWGSDEHGQLGGGGRMTSALPLEVRF